MWPDARLAVVVLKSVYDPQLAFDGPGDGQGSSFPSDVA
jgi:hypothetical protein